MRRIKFGLPFFFLFEMVSIAIAADSETAIIVFSGFVFRDTLIFLLTSLIFIDSTCLSLYIYIIILYNIFVFFSRG